jgi:hypothetical protein
MDWFASGICFHSADRVNASEATAASLAPPSHNRSQPDPRTGGPRLALDANRAHTTLHASRYRTIRLSCSEPSSLQARYRWRAGRVSGLRRSCDKVRGHHTRSRATTSVSASASTSTSSPPSHQTSQTRSAAGRPRRARPRSSGLGRGRPRPPASAPARIAAPPDRAHRRRAP